MPDNELAQRSDAPVAVEIGETASSLTETAKKPPPRTTPKWELDARDRLKAAIRRFVPRG
jgi:hypothetical protein